MVLDPNTGIYSEKAIVVDPTGDTSSRGANLRVPGPCQISGVNTAYLRPQITDQVSREIAFSQFDHIRCVTQQKETGYLVIGGDAPGNTAPVIIRFEAIEEGATSAGTILMSAAGVTDLHSISFDADGNLLVCARRSGSTPSDALLRFDGFSETVTGMISLDPDASGLYRFRGVATNPRNGAIWASVDRSGVDKVVSIDAAFTTATIEGDGPFVGGSDQPRGMAYDSFSDRWIVGNYQTLATGIHSLSFHSQTPDVYDSSQTLTLGDYVYGTPDIQMYDFDFIDGMIVVAMDHQLRIFRSDLTLG